MADLSAESGYPLLAGSPWAAGLTPLSSCKHGFIVLEGLLILPDGPHFPRRTSFPPLCLQERKSRSRQHLLFPHPPTPLCLPEDQESLTCLISTSEELSQRFSLAWEFTFAPAFVKDTQVLCLPSCRKYLHKGVRGRESHRKLDSGHMLAFSPI